MAFFNFYMLLGTLAISIPIILHILNRKSAKKVMWGAMRFLRDSLVSRQRKILLEEILLMCLRCLLILLLVLVAARPFITPGSQISWLVVMPMLLVSVASFAASFVLWAYPRWRRRMFVIALLLLVGAGSALIFEERLQARIFGGSGSRDIALVIDASDSMELVVDGVRNFDRAMEEAGRLVQFAPPGSAFSLVVGGSIPHAPIPSPMSSREDVLAALKTIRPEKGMMRAPDTLALAAFTLARGNNLAKQIIIIGDGQRAGWNVSDGSGEWEAVQASLNQLPSQPPVILRRFNLPDAIRNAAITDVHFSRNSIGLDRPVVISVNITNTGGETITPSRVELRVGEVSYTNEDLGQMPPGSTRTVTFDHRFEKPGAQVVEAELQVDDDLASDNHAWRVVTPVTRLDVLIVDGNPSPRFFERAASFAALALAPVPQTLSRAGSTEDPSSAEASKDRPLVRPRVVDLADFPQLTSLDAYAVIVLAAVPVLPEATAEALARYVGGGGGLLVAHGQQTNQNFYNQWSMDQEKVMPAPLEQNLAGGDVFPLAESFDHPALGNFRKESLDLPQVVLRAYWRLGLPAAGEEKSVHVGARLSNRDPFLIERSLGAGRVLQLASGLDSRDGNFSTSSAFVPFLHQLVYYLADSGRGSLNSVFKPGASLNLSALLPVTDRDARANLVREFGNNLRQMSLLDRDGVVKQGRLRLSDATASEEQMLFMTPPPDISPGLHHLQIPKQLQAALSGVMNAKQQLPFALIREGDEASLAPLTERDSGELRRYLLWQEALNEEALLAALNGARFGRELWRPIALAAFLLLLAEIAVCRWIAVRRRTGVQIKTEFQERNNPKENFRKQLEKMKKT